MHHNTFSTKQTISQSYDDEQAASVNIKHENVLQYIKSPSSQCLTMFLKSLHTDRLKWHHHIQTVIEVTPITESPTLLLENRT